MAHMIALRAIWELCIQWIKEKTLYIRKQTYTYTKETYIEEKTFESCVSNGSQKGPYI